MALAVSPLLAHIYAGPLLGYGASTLLLAREARPEARRIVLAGLPAYALLALLASLLHLSLFHYELLPDGSGSARSPSAPQS